MTVAEMAAEKLRAIAQRIRATDLADLAEMLTILRARYSAGIRGSGT
jgi:predicted nucleotidyltransferase component of viral defense system